MRTVLLYALLLGGAMVGSYMSWTADEVGPAAAGEVAVYRALKGEVASVAFKNETLDVKVERRSDARGEYAWIDVVERKKTPLPPEPVPPTADVPDAPEGDPTPDEPVAEDKPEERFEIEVIEQSFRGSDKALALIGGFEPLFAKRELDAALASTPSFGFDEPAGTLTIARKNGQDELVLGGSTYGSKDRYAKHEAKLYLLEDTIVRPIQFAATRLRERRLQPWQEGEVESIDVTRTDGVISFEQRNRDDRAKSFWSRGGEDAEDDSATTWLDKVFRLKASNRPKDPEGAVEPLLSIAFRQAGETWTLGLGKDTTDEGYFVTADFLRGTVPVDANAASELLADADELLTQ